jgi:hypothetical protein
MIKIEGPMIERKSYFALTVKFVDNTALGPRYDNHSLWNETKGCMKIALDLVMRIYC